MKDGTLFNKVRHISSQSQQDQDELKSWCQKYWDESLREEVTPKTQKVHFMCCNVFVDKDECTISGHSIESCRPLDHLCAEFQINSADSLYQAMLKWASDAISIGKQLKFPSLGMNHRGLSLGQQVVLDQAEVKWHRQRSSELQSRNQELERDNENLRRLLELTSVKTLDWCRFSIHVTQSWQELFEKLTTIEQEVRSQKASARKKSNFYNED